MIELLDFELSLDPFILGPLNLRLPAGGYGWLHGPSGAGKSLLLECIAGFWPQTAGALKLRGHATDGLAPEKRNIGWASQNATLFRHLDVFENIAFGLRMRDCSELTQEIHTLANAFGLSNLLDRRTGALSGGEKQRVNLARALATHPDILLLDEPFAHLEQSLREELQEIVHRRHRAGGLTVLHVTHHEPPPALTHTFHLDSGKILRGEPNG